MSDLKNYRLVLLRLVASTAFVIPFFLFFYSLHFTSEPLPLNAVFGMTFFFYLIGFASSHTSGSFHLRVPYLSMYVLYGFFVIVSLVWLFSIGFDVDNNGKFTISDVLPSLGYIVFSVGVYVAEKSQHYVDLITQFFELGVQNGTRLYVFFVQLAFFASLYWFRGFCINLSRKFIAKEAELIKNFS